MGKHFSFEGRMGRFEFFMFEVAEYILAILLYAFWASVAPLDINNPILVGVRFICVVSWVALFWANSSAVAKRFQDMDQGGYKWIFLFIPLVNIFLALQLHFRGGTQGINQYGPPNNSFSIKPLAVANFFIPIIVLLFVLNTRIVPRFAQPIPPMPGSPIFSTQANSVPVYSSDKEWLISEKGLKDSPIKSFVEYSADLQGVDGKEELGQRVIAWSSAPNSTEAHPFNYTSRYFDRANQSWYLGRYVFDAAGNLIDEKSVLTQDEKAVLDSIPDPFSIPEYTTEESYDEAGNLVVTSIDEDGLLFSRETFNSEEVLLVSETFFANGKPSSVYNYGDKGNHIEDSSFDFEGNQRSKHVSSYNEQGYKDRYYVYNDTSDWVYYDEYTYHKSNILKILRTKSDGSQMILRSSRYDDMDRLIENKSFSDSGILSSQTRSFYSETGASVKSNRTFNDKGQLLYDYVTTYGFDNSFISEYQIVTEEGSKPVGLTYAQFYTNDKGLLVKKEILDSDNIVTMIQKYNYNEFDDITEYRLDGNPLDTAKFSLADQLTRCSYNYDQYKNWIKRICLSQYGDLEIFEPQLDKFDNEVTFREIEYGYGLP